MLRENILQIIKENKENSEQCAIEICKYLDDELSLSDNGWFDNDEIMNKELEE